MLPSDILQTSTCLQNIVFCFFAFFCVFMFFVFSGLLRLLYFAFCTNSWRSSGFFLFLYFCAFCSFYVFLHFGIFCIFCIFLRFCIFILFCFVIWFDSPYELPCKIWSL